MKFSIEFRSPIPPSKTITIGTLGPSGSSSDYVSKYLVNQLEIEQIAGATQLFDSFTNVREALLQEKVDLALVPHAYQRINEFYMEASFDLSFIFVYPTPVYGLAKKKNQEVVFKGCKIVTHPAPLPLLSKLLPDDIDPAAIQVELTPATSEAALQVKQGLADLAITNEYAAQLYDLEFISIYGSIHMSWSIFHNKLEDSYV